MLDGDENLRTTIARRGEASSGTILAARREGQGKRFEATATKFAGSRTWQNETIGLKMVPIAWACSATTRRW